MEDLERLQAANRKHRDFRGDDRCWLDDEELYRTLPEGYTAPKRDSTVELGNCERFIRCRHNPGTTYVSPERMIEALRTRIKKLEEGLTDLAEHGTRHDLHPTRLNTGPARYSTLELIASDDLYMSSMDKYVRDKAKEILE